MTPFAPVKYVIHDKKELLADIAELHNTYRLTHETPAYLGDTVTQFILANIPLIVEQVEIGEPARRKEKCRKIGNNAIKTTILASGAAAGAILARYILSWKFQSR